jgi:hypothetical protein
MSNSPSFQPHTTFEAEAPFANVIGGDEFFGGDQWRDQRRMDGSEYGEPLGLGQEPAGPGNRLPCRALVIGGPAIPLPASNWQHELDTGPVRHLR